MTEQGANGISRRTFLPAAAMSIAFAGTQSSNSVVAFSKPKIGIVGAGRLGSTLAALWDWAGYDVMLSARDPHRVKRSISDFSKRVGVTSPVDAAGWADVLVIATPYRALPLISRTLAEYLDGKVVVDASNPDPARDGAMAISALERGAGLTSAGFFPKAHIVRAFNTIDHESLIAQAHRPGDAIGVPVAAEYLWQIEIAVHLVMDAGFEPVIAGELATAKVFDPGGKAFGIFPAADLRALLAA